MYFITKTFIQILSLDLVKNFWDEQAARFSDVNYGVAEQN